MEVTNRFKGLHLVDSVPVMGVCSTVEEGGIKPMPKKKKGKKTKWF